MNSTYSDVSDLSGSCFYRSEAGTAQVIVGLSFSFGSAIDIDSSGDRWCQ
jgi:hypothetical protein